MNEHQSELEQTTLLALGCLDEVETMLAREHLSACAVCTKEYAELRDSANFIGLSAEADRVQSELAIARVKKRLHSHVLPVRSSSFPVRLNRLAQFASVAACGVVVILGLFDYSLSQRMPAMEAHIAQLAATVNSTQMHLTEADSALTVLLSGGRHMLVKQGVIAQHDGDIYLVLHRLPALPPGHVFQAWTLPQGADAMQPDRTFLASEHGMTLVALRRHDPHMRAIALSIEPRGGSLHPTSTPIFVQALAFLADHCAGCIRRMLAVDFTDWDLLMFLCCKQIESRA
jgi:hypothetical protein